MSASRGASSGRRGAGRSRARGRRGRDPGTPPRDAPGWVTAVSAMPAGGRRRSRSDVRTASRRPGRTEGRRHGDDGGRGREAIAPRPSATVPYGEPHSQRRHGEADLLLRQAGERRRDPERDEPLLVEEPDRWKEQWCGERDRVEVVEDEPLGRRVEQVDERETGPRHSEPRCLRRQQVHGHRAEGDRERLDRQQHRGVGPQPPERCQCGDDRIEVRAEPRHLLAAQVRHLQHVSVSRRPHGLCEVSEVEPACLEGPVLQRRERCETGGERGDPPDQDRGRTHRFARSPLEQRAPAGTEHRLAGARLVGRPPSGPDPFRERRVGREPPHCASERNGVVRRHEQRVGSVSEQLTGRGCVRGHHRAGARERLEGLVGDHARGLLAGAENAESASCPLQLGGSCPYSTHRSHSTLAGRRASRLRAVRCRRL